VDQRELGVERCFQPGHVHVRVRGRRPQRGGGLYRQVLGQARRDDHPQPRTSQARGLPGAAHLVIDQGQNVPGRVQQHAARRGEPQPFVAAVQQRRAHDLFQAPDLLAQGGLGDEDPLCGVREAARIGDRYEVAQMPWFKALRRLRAVRGPRYWFWLCALHVGHPA
jgi:hypothetical protein